MKMSPKYILLFTALSALSFTKAQYKISDPNATLETQKLFENWDADRNILLHYVMNLLSLGKI